MWNPIFGWMEVEEVEEEGDSVRASDSPRDFIVCTTQSITDFMLSKLGVRIGMWSDLRSSTVDTVRSASRRGGSTYHDDVEG